MGVFGGARVLGPGPCTIVVHQPGFPLFCQGDVEKFGLRVGDIFVRFLSHLFFVATMVVSLCQIGDNM